MASIERIKNLIRELNRATAAYDEGHPLMSDEEWDNMYFELQRLEEEMHYFPNNSPTQRVVYVKQDALQKAEHKYPMLSLNKTKSLEELNGFISDLRGPAVAMLKMDGLSCCLTYENHLLVKAETRGDGIIGEDITENVRVIENVPKYINFAKNLIINGEIICKTDVFEKYGFNEQYKNPRNFAAGSIRLLDSAESASRHLSFIAWEVVESDSKKPLETLSEALGCISFRFDVVPYCVLGEGEITEQQVNGLKNRADELHYPIDGLVLKMDNIEKYIAAGTTAHHPQAALAFKFYDETVRTTLRNIEWGLGRDGRLTPVAIFDTITLEGTEVSRASLFNVSMMKETLGTPWIGRSISVMKSNQIIPVVVPEPIEEVPEGAEILEPPKQCPCCGAETVLRTDNASTLLYCINPECGDKTANIINHFCSKSAMDIKGFSAATIKKLLSYGWIQDYADLYNLKDHRAEWASKPSFGPTSVDKLLAAIETAKHSDIVKFLIGIGIPQIGNTVAKDLCKELKIKDYAQFRKLVAGNFNFTIVSGIGETVNDAIHEFDYTIADKAAQYITFEVEEEEVADKILTGKSICITGSLVFFKNRAALVAEIEKYGGKVTSAVTKRTNYLINNDAASTTAKNKTAQTLGIPILTEQDFLSLIRN